MTLLEEAKALGIRGAHLMKDETLEAKIAEAKSAVDKESLTPEQSKPVETGSKQKKKVTVEEARSLRSLIGDKTPAFLKFVEEHQADIPEEYDRVKKYIK